MLRKTLAAVACFAVLLLAPAARADDANKKTTFTFNETMQLPGLVLPAGTYIFKVPELATGMRSVVQVFNADETEILGTFLIRPYERIAPADKTHIWFMERKAGEANTIHEWFYPGDAIGMEFLYK